MFRLFTRQAKCSTGEVDGSKDILSGRYDSNALKVSSLHMFLSFCFFLTFEPIIHI